MRIDLERKSGTYHFSAGNEMGNHVDIDASPEIGGTNKGMRPMQLLLAGLGGCSVIDVISILTKQKQDVKDIKITIDGDREKDAVPSLFVDIKVHFTLFGDLDETKVKKALDLTFDKYCSVAKTLEKSSKISYTYNIVKS